MHVGAARQESRQGSSRNCIAWGCRLLCLSFAMSIWLRGREPRRSLADGGQNGQQHARNAPQSSEASGPSNGESRAALGPRLRGTSPPRPQSSAVQSTFPIMAACCLPSTQLTARFCGTRRSCRSGIPGDVSRTAPAYWKGTLITGQGVQTVHNPTGAFMLGIDAVAGRPLWRTQVEGMNPEAIITSSPVADDGVVYVGTSSRDEAVKTLPDVSRQRRGARSRDGQASVEGLHGSERLYGRRCLGKHAGRRP